MGADGQGGSAEGGGGHQVTVQFYQHETNEKTTASRGFFAYNIEGGVKCAEGAGLADERRRLPIQYGDEPLLTIVHCRVCHV